MTLDTLDLHVHHLFQYPATPQVIPMPNFRRRSIHHPFCPADPAKYWIDWRRDEDTSWRRGEEVGKEKSDKQKDMKLLYDPVAKNMILHVNTPVGTPGKYNVIFSPNDWNDWVRFPIIVCYVEEPHKLFTPEDYSLKFRPEDDHLKLELPVWPVVGGSNAYQCGTCQVRLAFDDDRIYGGWF